MSLVAKVVTGTLPNGTGTFDLTVAGAGTCKAAIFWVAGDVTNYVGTSISSGATSGTGEQWFQTQCSENGANKTNAAGEFDNDDLWRLFGAASQTIVTEGGFDSFITDGIRLNQTTNATNYNEAYRALLLFGDSSFTAQAGTYECSATQNGSVDTTGMGMDPDSGYFGCADETTDGIHAEWKRSEGFAGGGAQESYNTYCQDNSAKAANQETIRNDEVVFDAPSSWGIENSFITDGIRGTTRRGAPSLARSVGYLVWKDTDGTTSLVTSWAPTGTGNQAFTNWGSVIPQAVVLLSSTQTAWATTDTTTSHTVGVGVFDDTREGSIATYQEDNANTSNTESLASAGAFRHKDHDGTDSGTATFVSFETNGFTLNFGNSAAADWSIVFLIREDEGGGGGELGQKLIQTNQSLNRASSW